MVLIIVMMVVVLCYKCKVNKMKDNLALESANEGKTQSQVSVKNNHEVHYYYLILYVDYMMHIYIYLDPIFVI